MNNKPSPFRPINLLSDNIDTNDNSGVAINELKYLYKYIPEKGIKILERVFENELKSNDYIDVLGAQTLINETIGMEKRLKKFDLNKALNEIECLEIGGQNSLLLRFNNLKKENPSFNKDSIKVQTLHSAKSEFLEENFRIKKFSDFLHTHGLAEIALENINKLRPIFAEKKGGKKKYRIFETNGDFYLRGITSENYEDYNIPFSVCLCLLTIHRSYKNKSRNFKVRSIYIDDSNIEALFESDQVTQLADIGFLKLSILLSNDEIRRKAVGILGVSSIEYLTTEGKNRQVFFQPKKRLESAIFKIDHRITKDDKIRSSVQNFTDLVSKSEEKFFNDFKHLEKANDPNLLKFRIQEAIKNSREESIKPFKEEFKIMLEREVKNMIALLEIMNKLSLIAQKDLEAKQYIRYLYYKEIVKKPTR